MTGTSSDKKELQAHVKRIDAIYSTEETLQALRELEPDMRKRVILHALEYSKLKYTWSWMARQFRVPKREWPEQRA